MTETNPADITADEKQALDGIAVAPPEPADESSATAPETTHIREATDADDHAALDRDPSDADAKLDIGLDESFPSSDAPASTRPGDDGEPAPSSGYDEAAEKALADKG